MADPRASAFAEGQISATALANLQSDGGRRANARYISLRGQIADR